MKALSYNMPKTFLNGRISVDQATRILRKNGIVVNEEQAKVILDFLYLIARTISRSGASNI
jgi:hypothetical protein